MPPAAPAPAPARQDDFDLLDGDDDFWDAAETQLLSTPTPAPARGSSGPRMNAAPMSAPAAASRAGGSGSISRQNSFSAASSLTKSGQPNLQLNPKIGTVRPGNMWTTGNNSRAKSSGSFPAADGAPATQSSSSGPSGFRQRTLFGDVLQDANVAGPSRSRSGAAPGRESSSRGGRASQSQRGDGENLTAQMTFKAQKVTKQWDFSQPTRKGKSGKKEAKGKGGKGKQKAKEEEDEDIFSDWSGDDGVVVSYDTDDSDDDEKGHKPLAAAGATAPMKLRIDEEAAKTWVYPTNKSFRDYQFNIVQKALFNNVLVALPTGLGKTFIAAVVILNFYRWFPEGKIIFVAPTRPLVSQQQIACHGICGLPWDQAIELTGSTKKRMRGDEWQTKRIFYMTPQTFENDLMSSSCDPRDVVCLVVDEAHRATGNYAYGCVVRHLMRYNRHFRVLALTATPGSKSEKVQEVIDSLHIGHIEIRSEDALDIRSYVHKKVENRIVVSPGPVVGPIQEAFGIMMRTYLDKAIGAGVLRSGTDPKTLHSFFCRSLMKDRSKKAEFDAKPFLRSCLTELASMADCMQALIIYSVEMFRNKFYDVASKAANSQGPKRKLYSRENKQYQTIMDLLEDAKDPKTNQVVHPKMQALLDTVQQHFVDHDEETEQAEIAHWTAGDGLRGQPAPRKRETKAMVFCHYRESVAELVVFLNANGLKAVSFVGQASSKGSRGCTQKQQEQIIKDFKAGKTNVIIATSIGEEGLDIGEVDLIVCYDAQKDPVRMLQRIGRTGRQRDGKIYVLLSEGKEENNWQQSKDSYKTVQKEINAGITCELFDDVERLVPKTIQPTCVKQDVEQHEFDPELINLHLHMSQKRPAGKALVKKERKDPMRNMPQGSILGFLKASEVRNPASSSKLKIPAKVEEEEADEFADADDDDDEFDWSILDQISTQKLNGKAQKDPSRSQAPKGRTSLGTQSIYIPKPVQLSPTPSPFTDFASSAAPAPASSSVGRDQVISTSSGTSTSRRSKKRETSSMSSVQDSPRWGAPHPLVVQMAAEQGIDIDSMSGSSSKRRIKTVLEHDDEDEDEDEDEDDAPLVQPRRFDGKRAPQRLFLPSSSSPSQAPEGLMPPPPVRRAGPAPKRKRDLDQDDARPTDARQRSKAPKKLISNSPSSKGLFAYEAERDTDEEMHGERDEHDEGLNTDEADSSDREHVGDFTPTQHPDRKYDQRSIYAQSLLTQNSLTPFKRPARSFGVGGIFGEGGIGHAGFDAKGNPIHTSRAAPAPMDGSDDRYTEDSFVVGDDEEIEYATDDD
ncbi:unnamed protein product [Tilletia controversa]|uniref:ATP-dependent DNA helicase n=3 Tax=Tilletia TaxID=13289 RepID=A0A8X7MV04_9BASI|nr:hypothetical protein CF336_g4140 [Tilletia laevis]KAE8197366.1 hypothetical protein CF328_g3871 [Tilletia controversa]KAE8261137.1 hypothetical protein A4X03_0g3510 [Tilletia caries]KAE8202023.1 hypothetical protein CF335_g3573 [Tilletia laevis]KAE8250126.1 hypothetical protein A4X06_0g2909 [Tilletia controversa]